MGLFDAIFSPGKMEVILEKYNNSPGEMIKGTIKFTTKKPVHANGVFVKLYGIENVKQHGHGNTSSRSNYVFNFEQPLDGEKDYTGGEYPFEIKIPADVQQKGAGLPEGVEAAAKIAGALMGHYSSRKIDWYIDARLDVPGGRDISKKLKVNIG